MIYTKEGFGNDELAKSPSTMRTKKIRIRETTAVTNAVDKGVHGKSRLVYNTTFILKVRHAVQRYSNVP